MEPNRLSKENGALAAWRAGNHAGRLARPGVGGASRMPVEADHARAQVAPLAPADAGGGPG